jgi:hypothetical protein
MSLKLTVSKEDAKRAQIVEPGWYQALIKDIDLKKSTDGTSMTFHISCVITTPGSANSVPIKTYVSEKAPGMAIPMLNATGSNIDPENFEGADFDLERCIGKAVDIAVENETYEGKMKNTIKDFAPIGTQTAA